MRPIPKEITLHLRRAMDFYHKKDLLPAYEELDKVDTATRSVQAIGTAMYLEENKHKGLELIYVKYIEVFINEIVDNPNNMNMFLWVVSRVPKEKLQLCYCFEWAEIVEKEDSATYLSAVRKFNPNDDYFNVMHPNGYTANTEDISQTIIEPVPTPEGYVPFKHPFPHDENSWIYKIYFKEKERRGL